MRRLYPTIVENTRVFDNDLTPYDLTNVHHRYSMNKQLFTKNWHSTTFIIAVISHLRSHETIKKRIFFNNNLWISTISCYLFKFIVGTLCMRLEQFLLLAWGKNDIKSDAIERGKILFLSQTRKNFILLMDLVDFYVPISLSHCSRNFANDGNVWREVASYSFSLLYGTLLERNNISLNKIFSYPHFDNGERFSN